MTKEEIKTLIETTLKELSLYSTEAVELLVGTCAQESSMGKYRRQIGGGPALGIFQMEPRTFNDIVENFLNYKKNLKEKVMTVSGITEFNPLDLLQNDKLATAMARIHYLRVSSPIPTTLEEQARYYKKYYNTEMGMATVEEYLRNYKKYCS